MQSAIFFPSLAMNGFEFFLKKNVINKTLLRSLVQFQDEVAI
jgi:hypothetical protein